MSALELDAIDVREAARRAASGALLLVDVREPAEWRGGHAAAATLVPLHDVPRRLDELGACGVPVAFMCATAYRSAAACATARAHGIPAVNVRGGMRAWRAAGLPVAV